MERTTNAGRWELGWFGVAVAALLISSPVRALDLDREAKRHDADASQILGTLVARGKPAPKAKGEFQVRLRKRHL